MTLIESILVELDKLEAKVFQKQPRTQPQAINMPQQQIPQPPQPQQYTHLYNPNKPQQQMPAQQPVQQPSGGNIGNSQNPFGSF